MPDTSDTNATRVLHERHECDTRAARTTRVQHECYTNDTSAAWVKNFYFDNNTNENIFSHLWVYYRVSERLQEEEKLHSKNYFWEMHCSRVKMRLKSAPRKLNFLMGKTISKGYTQDCSCRYPCTFPHSYV